MFDRVKDLTRQLLTFSKGGSPIKKTLNVATLLRKFVKFSLSGSNVASNFNIDENLWFCSADENQIGQVIDNLVINAVQAMPNGGELIINANNFTIEKEFTTLLTPGNYIQISFSDQGFGIPKEHLIKIFDPFFSTKKKGSGLGLATAYSIIKKHGGAITAESEEGKGSKITIFLPAVITEESIHCGSSINERVKLNGRILIMDDEEYVLDILKNMLVEIGVEVITATDGSEALKLVKDALISKKHIDAAILDLTIPNGMGGKEASLEINKIAPHIKCIVSSGYSSESSLTEQESSHFYSYLNKPYTFNELSEMIKKVINFNKVVKAE